MPVSNFQKAKIFSPDLPWCQDEPELLGPKIMEFIYNQEAYVRRWAQRWFENFNFIYGNQNVRWSRRYDFAVDVDFLRRESPLQQRTQTNLARTIAEALASMVYASVPQWETDSAESSSLKGKRFSTISQKLLDAYMERLLMDDEFATAAMMYVTYGQCAAKVKWNRKAGQLLEIPKFEKVRAPVYSTFMGQNEFLNGLLETAVQVRDSMGQPIFQDKWEPVLDVQGRQVINKVHAGDVDLEMLTPFQYMVEPGSHGMHRTKYIDEIRLLDYDDWLSEYGELDGQTKDFDSVGPNEQGGLLYAFAVRHLMRMRFVTPPNMTDTFRRIGQTLKGNIFKHKVLVVEHWDKPNDEKWPKGRRVIVANGKCTHITKPEFSTNKKDGWHPYVEAQWMKVAPSSIATGPMNDVIQKNREVNVSDSLTSTALRRNLGSMLLVKTGAGLDRGKITGEPGQIHEVSDIDGARWVHDANPIPPVIQALRDSYKQDVYEVSGAMDALRGDRSKGVSSGYALRQLEEREQKRLTPARKQFEKFAGGIGEKIIACLQQNVSQLDDNVMGYMTRKASGEFQPHDIVAFLSHPIDFGVDIKVKSGSMAMRSKATEQATYLDLAKGPAQQRLQQDAKVLDDFLKFFDADHLRDASAAHRDRSNRENEVFMDMARLGPDMEGITAPVVIFEDDDDIHIAEHTDFMIKHSDEIMGNDTLLRAVILHLEQHRIQKQEKMGQMMPGTQLALPGMMQAMKPQQPAIPMIYQYNQQKQAQELQKMQQAENVKFDAMQQGKNPQAPKPPQPSGQPGPGEIDANAPSQNTPMGATQGGAPQ